MSSHAIGLLIGGIVPAILFGVSNVLVKASTEKGIGPAMYVLVVGVASVVAGLLLLLFLPNKQISVASASYAFAAGFTWAVAITGVTVALEKYNAPLSELVPLYNMNTLVAVLLALWVFAEWKEVDMVKLLTGTVFIVIGGVLVAKA